MTDSTVEVLSTEFHLARIQTPQQIKNFSMMSFTFWNLVSSHLISSKESSSSTDGRSPSPSCAACSSAFLLLSTNSLEVRVHVTTYRQIRRTDELTTTDWLLLPPDYLSLPPPPRPLFQLSEVCCFAYIVRTYVRTYVRRTYCLHYLILQSVCRSWLINKIYGYNIYGDIMAQSSIK